MSASLFTPIEVGTLDLPNRIAVAPMCQYSADDGSATDWHLQHWMMLAMTGAGMVTVEMTDVERRGRITHGCLGLYSDHNEAAARRTRRRAAGRGAGREVRHPARPRRPQGVVPGGPGRAAARSPPTPTPGRPSPPRPCPMPRAGTRRTRSMRPRSRR